MPSSAAWPASSVPAPPMPATCSTMKLELPRRYRDFTWRALRHRLEKKESVLEGIGSPVNWLVFSPDSRRLALVDQTGTVKLWDVSTGRELKTLFQPSGSISWMQLERLENRATEYGRLRGSYAPVSAPQFSSLRSILGHPLASLWQGSERHSAIAVARVHGRERGGPRPSRRRARMGRSRRPSRSSCSQGRNDLPGIGSRDGREAQLRLPREFGEVADLVFDRAGEQVLLISKDGRLPSRASREPPDSPGRRRDHRLERAYFRFSPDGTRVAVVDRRRLSKDCTRKRTPPRNGGWKSMPSPARIAQVA